MPDIKTIARIIDKKYHVLFTSKDTFIFLINNDINTNYKVLVSIYSTKDYGDWIILSYTIGELSSSNKSKVSKVLQKSLLGGLIEDDNNNSVLRHMVHISENFESILIKSIEFFSISILLIVKELTTNKSFPDVLGIVYSSIMENLDYSINEDYF